MRHLALPGDEDTVVAFLIREAIKREGRLTREELIAYDYSTRCSENKERWARHGGVWHCTYREPCDFCRWSRNL